MRATVWVVEVSLFDIAGSTVHTVPYGTDLFRAVSLAVNCQATITGSLRDKDLPAPVRKIDSTPTIEDEDDDEYEDDKMRFGERSLYKELSTGYALLTFMNKNLGERLRRQGLWLAACLVLVATNHVSAGTTAGRPESQIYQLPLPDYGDSTPWGKYFRQLQDTVATRWYQEIVYYTHRYEYNWGTVTARYTVTPDGSFHNPQVLSNTCGPAMPSAVIRSIRKTWIQPFPPAVVSMAPAGLVVEQTFRYWQYDGTNYGLASSYPQLLVNRAPEIGGGQYLNLRKFFDLSRFRFQSRILEATPASGRLAER